MKILMKNRKNGLNCDPFNKLVDPFTYIFDPFNKLNDPFNKLNVTSLTFFNNVTRTASLYRSAVSSGLFHVMLFNHRIKYNSIKENLINVNL